MSAAKKIRLLIENQASPAQVAVLKNLAIALESGNRFDLADLYGLDMSYFVVAIELLLEWRLDRHMPSRNELMAQLTQESNDVAQGDSPA